MIDPFPAIPIFLIIFAAMLVRTLTGFGSALIAVPLLSILLGAKYAGPLHHDLRVPHRPHDPRKSGVEAEGGGDLARAWPLLAIGLAGVPLGAEVLIFASERILQGGMGIALIVFSLLLLRDLKPKLARSGIGPPGGVSLRVHRPSGAADGPPPPGSGLREGGVQKAYRPIPDGRRLRRLQLLPLGRPHRQRDAQ